MMIPLAALAVFSGLSLNLLLSFAIGAAGIAGDVFPKAETKRQLPLFQLVLLFIAVLFLWMFFSFMLPPHWMGFSVYFLFFPLSALVCMGLESFTERLFSRRGNTDAPRGRNDASVSTGAQYRRYRIKKVFSALTAYDGLVPASLIITFTLAGSFAGAFVLSFFFALGNLAAILILNEIRRRSNLEWVPRHLRGSPLILISMGLLALVSAFAAGICFKILKVFQQ